jgi:sugar phosphate isomerase/epimerase
MKNFSRRAFIGNSGKGLAASMALSGLSFPTFIRNMGLVIEQPFGFQTWVVREMLAKDFPGTLKIMASEGYRQVEMCSPEGYVDSGFGPLTKIKPADMKKIINDTGLSCPSCHFGFEELTDHLDERIEWSKQLGLSVMVCSSFGLPKTATLDDYLKACDKLNKAAEKIKKAGLQTGYHNHDMEFHMLDNQLIYDALMKRFDADLVKMQFQTQVITLGYKASTYFNKYPGRFISSHLSDWTAEKKEVPLGQGIINWKEFFEAAKTGGVKYFYVEMNFDTLAPSAAYLKQLTL